MAVLRVDIERALDELIFQEEGMRFQGLAVVLGKKRWPELIALQRKQDGGLDAYAPASETEENVGKGLAASITGTLKKVAGDAETAKEELSRFRGASLCDPVQGGQRGTATLGRDDSEEPHPRPSPHRARGNHRPDADAGERLALWQLPPSGYQSRARRRSPSRQDEACGLGCHGNLGCQDEGTSAHRANRGSS